MRETITVSHNGARMHFEIILPEMSLSVEHDEISMRLVVGNSYDGSRKVTIAFGAYRVVCANGMIIGRKLLSVSHRHLGEVSLQVAQIREQIAGLTKLFKNSAPIMRKMASTPLTSNKQFFDAKALRLPTYLARIASQQFSRAEDPTRVGRLQCPDLRDHPQNEEAKSGDGRAPREECVDGSRCAPQVNALSDLTKL